MKKNIIIFSLGIIFTLSIVFFTKMFYELQPKIIETQRNPDDAYVDIVSKTEYYAGEEGQAIVRVSDWQGNPLTANCNVTILFPNKTYWLIDSPLSASSISGNYYDTFTIPDVLGVYEYHFTCFVNWKGGMTIEKSSTFHVSIAYQKFQEIIDKLDALNQTMININNTNIELYNNLSQQISDLENNMYNNFTYTNILIENVSSQMNTSFLDLKSYIHIRYLDLKAEIYECCRKWAEVAEDTLDNILGTSQHLERILSGTTGVASGCSVTDRILGKC
jgi:hypothetical protein